MGAFWTILHPTDLTEDSMAAFRVACRLARDGTRLVVVHVIEESLAASDRSALDEVRNAAVERGQLRVIGFGDFDVKLFVDTDHEVEEVHRIEVQLLAQAEGRLDLVRLDLGRDVAEDAEDSFADLDGCHSWPGSCNRRSTAFRKMPPRWPSVTR